MKRVVLIGLACILLLMGLQPPMRTHAAEERIEFGSEAYRWEVGVENPIGVHFYAYYNVTLIEFDVTYDDRMMTHISGGETVESGRVRIRSEFPFSGAFSTMLHFVPIMGGSTTISVRDVSIHTEDGEIIELDRVRAPVHLEAPEGAGLAMISINGEEIEGFRYDEFTYDLEIPYDAINVAIVAIPLDDEVDHIIIERELNVGRNRITIIAEHPILGNVRYVLNITRNEEEEYAYYEEPEEIEVIEDIVIPEPTVVHVADDGVNILGNRMLFAVILILLLLLLFYLVYEKVRIVRRRKWREKIAKHQERRKRREGRREKEVFDDFDAIDDFNLVDERKVEIKVMGVTMDYEQEQDESGSLKELVLKIIKRERKIKYLRALDDITFNVKQGEIVGIVGTNGSGKSTLLKIISGVLPPTAGKVEVDRSKIQLLTLGTGFDMELTGKENVYLNGALIGYTKEYIDERYDEIVAFAELEDFMDEKVKTYSSGMVSRLGFAIATARDAPGILILDEVLSVGDMHFAKKSKEKVKELIHSGSTVLIVSHSPSTIRENCTSAIWLEKSKLMMQGDVEAVCKAYEGKAV